MKSGWRGVADWLDASTHWTLISWNQCHCSSQCKGSVPGGRTPHSHRSLAAPRIERTKDQRKPSLDETDNMAPKKDIHPAEVKSRYSIRLFEHKTV